MIETAVVHQNLLFPLPRNRVVATRMCLLSPQLHYPVLFESGMVMCLMSSTSWPKLSRSRCVISCSLFFLPLGKHRCFQGLKSLNPVGVVEPSNIGNFVTKLPREGKSLIAQEYQLLLLLEHEI